MRLFALCTPFILIVLLTSPLPSATIHVPADQPTIQAGIDVAADGDTVMVADGTYTGDGNRDIDFLGKAIVVTSENGPGACVIDCEGSIPDPHRGFIFHSGEDSNAVLRGFTITNGFVRFDGGAIYCFGSSPTITQNIVTGNSAAWGDAGGVILWDSFSTLSDNEITENNADKNGGGIYCLYASPMITGNEVTGNSASTGGAINSEHSSPTVIDNDMIDNCANTYGGAVYVRYGDPLPVFARNTVTGNTASSGGAFYDYRSDMHMINCTLSGNVSNSGGGGMTVFGSQPLVHNSIIWGNDSGSGHEIIQAMGADVTATYSNVKGGWEGEGNIDAYPQYVLPAKGDCRLQWESPCIDAGQPDSLDIDGTICDMGAHCYDQRDYLTIYLTPDSQEIERGGQLEITCTVINRWNDAESFWGCARVLLPSGIQIDVIEPRLCELAPGSTQQLTLVHHIPITAPTGVYAYEGLIGVPPETLYDEDSFTFAVTD